MQMNKKLIKGYEKSHLLTEN